MRQIFKCHLITFQILEYFADDSVSLRTGCCVEVKKFY